MATGDPDRLDSWKEIAAFIRRDERTAMRWAARQGMPVHRVPGGKRGRVFSSRKEISEWLGRQGDGTLTEAPDAKAEPPSAGSLRWAYIIAAVLGASALFVYTVAFHARESRGVGTSLVTHVTFTSDAVVGWHGNRQLWAHEFSRPLVTDLWGPAKTLSAFVRILDLDHGKKRVVVLVAPFHLQPNPDSLIETDVDCFSNRGKLLWSYVPHREFQFGRNELGGPWDLSALYVSEIGTQPSLWVAEGHYLWGNTFVAEIDPRTGHATIRFVNTGVLYALNEVKTPRATYLVAGGFNNEYSAGILAVINENKPFAVSPQTPGTRHQCVSCGPGVPDEYFVFPRTEINRIEGVYQDPVTLITVGDGQIEAHKAEALGTANANTIYLFRTSPAIQPVSLRYDSSYDILYRHFEREGKFRQSLADATERRHPLPVNVWTPANGWEEYPVLPTDMIASRPRQISRPPRYPLASPSAE